jgi:hypothetical protein
MTVYRYVLMQIVGNVDHWTTAYYPSPRTWATAKLAGRDGIRREGHDDFVIAGIRKGDLLSVVDAHGEPLTEWKAVDYELAAAGLGLAWAGPS